jgi:hypothetical protein
MVLGKSIEGVSPEYVKSVNKTYSVMCSRKSKLPKIIVDRVGVDVATNDEVLDFGAGKHALGTEYLREHGFRNVTAYEIGDNFVKGLHDSKALKRRYDIVMMSSVLNVQPDGTDVLHLLMKAQSLLYMGGLFFCNYPKPRKNDLNIEVLEASLRLGFDTVDKVDNTPAWVCKYYS